jgi:hypothetical protein
MKFMTKAISKAIVMPVLPPNIAPKPTNISVRVTIKTIVFSPFIAIYLLVFRLKDLYQEWAPGKGLACYFGH